MGSWKDIFRYEFHCTESRKDESREFPSQHFTMCKELQLALYICYWISHSSQPWSIGTITSLLQVKKIKGSELINLQVADPETKLQKFTLAKPDMKHSFSKKHSEMPSKCCCDFLCLSNSESCGVYRKSNIIQLPDSWVTRVWQDKMVNSVLP